MNFCFITACIIKKLEKLQYDQNPCIALEIKFPHVKNYCARAFAFAYGEMADHIFEFYMVGDYILIEGEILTLKISKTQDIIYINDVQPAVI